LFVLIIAPSTIIQQAEDIPSKWAGPENLFTGSRLVPTNKEKPFTDFSGRLSFLVVAGLRTQSAVAQSKGGTNAQDFQMAFTHAPGWAVHGRAFNHFPGTAIQSGRITQQEDKRSAPPRGANSTPPAEAKPEKHPE
jgi:hypothetical protein